MINSNDDKELLYPFFRSVLEMDRAAVVLCDLEHTIIYMNPAAVTNYAKYGGSSLLGKSVLDCHNDNSRRIINEVLDWFREAETNNIKYIYHNPKQNKDVYMVALRDAHNKLIGYYEKHEYRDREQGQ